MDSHGPRLPIPRPGPAPLSRRTLLRWALLATGLAGCGGGGDAAGTEGHEPDESQALSDRAIRVLRKLAEVYTGVPASSGPASEETPFDEYFRWWADRREELRSRYEQATGTLDRTARQLDGRPFAECPSATCLRVVDQAFPPGGKRDRFVADVRRPLLRVYANTYAWTDMGYASWAGRPRGLDLYLQPPPGAGVA